MDTGIAITISGFFVSLAAILISAQASKRTNLNAYYTSLEGRIKLCEEDRAQLHAEISQLRDQNFWLSTKLQEAGK